MSATPPVSIGLPVYNGERYLASALDSLVGQTFTDFELVIGDNGSTDATAEIAAAYAAADERVRLMTSDVNRGAAWNYNRVFHATRGALFRWAAYDDLMRPAYLERLVQLAGEAPTETVLFQSRTTLIDEDGAEVGDWDDRFDLSTSRPGTRLAALVRHLVMSNLFFGLVRRSAMERTRLHGAYPSADYVFLAELALLGPFAIEPERLFLRRVHPSMSRYAHTTLEDVADWFEPGTSGTVQPETVRLFVEHLRAISHSPMRLDQKLGVTAVFLPAWMRRRRGRMARELWSMATRRLRPS